MMKQVFDALFLGAGIFSHGAVLAFCPEKKTRLGFQHCVCFFVGVSFVTSHSGWFSTASCVFLEDFYPEQNPTMQRSTELLSIASFQTNPKKIQNSTLKTIFIYIYIFHL